MILVLLASTSLLYWLKNPALLDVKAPAGPRRTWPAWCQPRGGFCPLTCLFVAGVTDGNRHRVCLQGP